MPTMTMQSIADLTRVQRGVVSMWRTRSADTAHPFPNSLSGDELVFDAQQIASWLQATGRGNNPEAPLEVLLHSSRFGELLDDPDASSALCLLHDLVGGPLAEAGNDEVRTVIAQNALDPVISPDRVADLLAQGDLVRAVDDLAEAAFSGRALLDRLVDTFSRPGGPWAAYALTSSGSALIVEILRGLLELAPRRLDTLGPGGLLLATDLARALEDEKQLVYGVDLADDASSASRTAIRMLAVHAPSGRVSDRTSRPDEPHLSLTHCQSTESPEEFFEKVESVLLDLGPSDIAVVVGPSTLLLDPLHDKVLRAARTRLLLPHPTSPAPLRYVARLPKGLSRFGGRRRLAMWVFGTAAPHAGTEWTVYGEHADTSLDDASRGALAADVAAALTGGSALTAHAFLRSTRLATSALLGQQDLVLTPFSVPTWSGGESLARLWELDDGLIGESISLHATDENRTDPTIRWSAALDGLAQEIRGARLPAETIGAPGPGRVAVFGPDEVRNPDRLGQRTINRLVLEKSAPRSTLTEAGDVVFVAEGGADAAVDTVGGHVLQAPARILRCQAKSSLSRVLHPRVVAADIARQEGRDRHTWQLRTVPAEAVPALDVASRRLEQRRAELRRQRATLDQLEDELIQAVAAGTLAATVTTPMKEN